ncbi:MAG: TrbI/VirB10 family protein [Acidithiobacillus sp.]|nr:TrbI/VirB10 family protein [Acidithiobacillus sp.]
MSDENDPTALPSDSTSDENNPPPPKKKVTFISNLKRFYTNPETRVNAILLTAIAGAMIAFGLYDLAGGDSAKAVVSSTGSASHVKNLPGGNKGGALYNKNLNALNEKRAEQAAHSGQTFIPTLGPLHHVAPKPPKLPPKKPPVAAPAPAAPAPAPAAPKETTWQKNEAKDAQMELMRFINAPVPVPLTVSLRSGATKSDGGVPLPSSSHSTSQSGHTGPVLANPGHIAFGELITSINSNEPGPVEAEIVSGRFKGAKVLGSFKREKDRLVVKLDEMTWNHQSYKISAYAINAKTARTYVATSVNHHTLVRWGGLIAASFLGGIDDALSMANSTTTLSNGYAAVTNQLTNGEIPLDAAGNVGNVLTPILAKRFNEPPTVREAQGAPIGLLFMEPVR